MTVEAPPLDAKRVVEYVRMLKARNSMRDVRHRDITAIRDGDYEKVAPGVFPADFPKAMVANLIDTAARDVSEMMAPMPGLSCASVAMTSDRAKKFAERRAQMAQNYVQASRLQRARYAGADRYVTYGFMAYIVEPSFTLQQPTIRLSCVPSSYYVLDYFGKCKMFAEVTMVPTDVLMLQYTDAKDRIRQIASGPGSFGMETTKKELEVIKYYSDDFYATVLADSNIVLAEARNPIGKCPVTIVERPSVTREVHGQFDDVIWVQIVRAMVANYTMSAIEQSVNAPIVVPTGTSSIELGPLSTLETDNPQGVGRLPLAIPQGLFPEAAQLGQEQLTGSRYPQGRTGSTNASVITGQGVQALMGTFDTQIQTFQRLDAIALEDALTLMYEMDETVWKDVRKTVVVKDAGSPYEVTYIPSRDIAGDYTIDVSYGAIAGLDPNRGLVFILQTLASQLISKDTARRHLPVDIDPVIEDVKINTEAIRDSLTSAVLSYSQSIPALAAQGQDVTGPVTQIAEILKLVQKNEPIDQAVLTVLAPKQSPEQAATAAAPGATAPGGAAATPQTPGQALMSMLAGNSVGGSPRLTANVQRTQPVVG